MFWPDASVILKGSGVLASMVICARIAVTSIAISTHTLLLPLLAKIPYPWSSPVSRNRRVSRKSAGSQPSELADQLLRGVGDGSHHVARACEIARAAVADGAYDRASSLHALASLGTFGTNDANEERDLQRWVRFSNLRLEAFEFLLSIPVPCVVPMHFFRFRGTGFLMCGVTGF